MIACNVDPWIAAAERSDAVDSSLANELIVDRIRTLFLSCACIAAGFSAADRWTAGGRVEGQRRAARAYRRAYLLGCVRTYFALLSHPGAPLISSLRNLAALLAEVAEAPASPAYWQHLARQVEESG